MMTEILNWLRGLTVAQALGLCLVFAVLSVCLDQWMKARGWRKAFDEVSRARRRRAQRKDFTK